MYFSLCNVSVNERGMIGAMVRVVPDCAILITLRKSAFDAVSGIARASWRHCRGKGEVIEP